MRNRLLPLAILLLLACAGCASRIWGGYDYVCYYEVDLADRETEAKVALLRERLPALAKEMGLRPSERWEDTYTRDADMPLPDELCGMSGSGKIWYYSVSFHVHPRDPSLRSSDPTMQLRLNITEEYCGYPTEYLTELNRRIRALFDEIFGAGNYRATEKRRYRPWDLA
jgi:hypothetical protein